MHKSQLDPFLVYLLLLFYCTYKQGRRRLQYYMLLCNVYFRISYHPRLLRLQSERTETEINYKSEHFYRLIFVIYFQQLYSVYISEMYFFCQE